MIRPWLSLIVAERRQEAADVVGLSLVDPQGRDLPPFSAGAHIDVELAEGLIRQYSLCNRDPGRNCYEIAVLREPASRGGSIAAHALTPGQAVRVSEPRNHFPLAAGAAHSLLFAGGIGITPIIAMADRLATVGESFELHYCARSPERMAFRERLATCGYADQVSLHFDDGPASQQLDAAAVLRAAPAGSHVYVCGPSGFIDHVLAAAAAAGLDRDQLHREYFAAEAAPPAVAPNGGFDLQLARSGLTVRVSPGQTAVQALQRVGVEVPVSCEQGVCGTCLLRVIEGQPDHRDLFLTDEEHARNDQFTPCCSRSKTAVLIIDL